MGTVKYVLKIVKNPQNRTKHKFYYAPRILERMSYDMLIDKVAARSSASRGDIKNVLRNLFQEIGFTLREGYTVDLGDLGTMRVVISSRGDVESSRVNASNITHRRVVYRMRQKTREKLKDTRFTPWSGRNW